MEQRLFKFELSEKGLLKIYDRFSFDNLLRILLVNGFQYEEALNFILCNCELSSLVFQERIYNGYYRNIDIEDTISPDLLELEKKCLIEIMGEYLNVKEEIGAVSQWIRECSPKTLDDWKDCYYKKLPQFLKSEGVHLYPNLYPKEYIEDLGRKLYVKITEGYRC